MPSELALRLLPWCGSWPTASALFWWWHRLDPMSQIRPYLTRYCGHRSSENECTANSHYRSPYKRGWGLHAREEGVASLMALTAHVEVRGQYSLTLSIQKKLELSDALVKYIGQLVWLITL